jgi:tRNA (guanine-N7-)-methyltransferase
MLSGGGRMSLTGFSDTKTKGRKAGRMSTSERDAFDRLLPVVGLNPQRLLDRKKAFGREAPLFLEIGFGRGTFLLEKACLVPENDFIGIEIYRPGIAKLLKGLAGMDGSEGLSINNLRVYNHNAANVLIDCIPENSLDGVYILFPDPWHKTRHRKRRLINHQFCSLLLSRIRSGGSAVVATDHMEYAAEIERAFDTAGFMLESKNISDIWTTAYALKARESNSGFSTFRFIRG